MRELVKLFKVVGVVVGPPLLVRGFLDIAGADRDTKDIFTFIAGVVGLEALAVEYTGKSASLRTVRVVRRDED